MELINGTMKTTSVSLLLIAATAACGAPSQAPPRDPKDPPLATYGQVPASDPPFYGPGWTSCSRFTTAPPEERATLLAWWKGTSRAPKRRATSTGSTPSSAPCAPVPTRKSVPLVAIELTGLS
jgi:hypothetical protein